MEPSPKFFLLFILLVFSGFLGYGQTQTVFAEGESLIENREFKKAFKEYNRIYNLFDSETAPEVRSECLLKMGHLQLLFKNYDSALEYYNQVLEQPTSLENLERACLAENSIAFIFKKQSKESEVVEHFQEAVKLANAANNDSLIGLSNFNLGLYLKQVSAFQESSKYLIKAIETLDGKNIKLLPGRVHQTLANVLREQKKYKESIDYHQKAIEFKKSEGNPSDISRSYNDLGNTYKMMEDYDTAIEYYNLSLEIKKSYGSTDKLFSKTHANLGEAYMKKGDFALAKEQFALSLQLKKSSGDNEGEAYIYTQLGELALKLKNYQKALNYLDSGLVLIESLDVPSIEEENLKLQKTAYSKIGQFEMALKFGDRYNAIHDSIFDAQSIQISEGLRIGYEAEKQEKEIVSLYRLNQTQLLEIERQELLNNGLFIAAGLFLIISSLLFYLVRLSKKNVKLKSALLEDAQHRTKNFLQTLISLFSFQANHIDDPKAKAAVREGESRVNAMMIIHRHFAQPNLQNTQLDFSDYTRSLCNQLKLSFQKPGQQVNLKFELDSVMLEAYQSTPLALILNELVSNSLKYALIKELNVIRINLKRLKDNQLQLQVIDNGPGLPKNFNIDSLNSSGMKLIRLFTKQLKGTFEFANDSGLRSSIKVEV